MRTPIYFLCLAMPLLQATWASAEAPPIPEKVAALIRQLGSDEARARDAAQAELLDLGIPILDYIEEARQSSDVEIRARASAIAKKLRRKLRERTAPKLAAMARDGEIDRFIDQFVDCKDVLTDKQIDECSRILIELAVKAHKLATKATTRHIRVDALGGKDIETMNPPYDIEIDKLDGTTATLALAARARRFGPGDGPKPVDLRNKRVRVPLIENLSDFQHCVLIAGAIRKTNGIKNCLVVCSGPIESTGFDHCIVFANSGGTNFGFGCSVAFCNGNAAGVGLDESLLFGTGQIGPSSVMHSYVEMKGLIGEDHRRARNLPSVFLNLDWDNVKRIRDTTEDAMEDRTRFVQTKRSPLSAVPLFGARCGAEFADVDGGVAVKAVVGGSGLARAGLKPGDRIVAGRGVKVTTTAEVLRILRGRQEGEPVRLRVYRHGELATVRICD